MKICKCTLEDKRLFYQRILETKGELPPCSVVLLEREAAGWSVFKGSIRVIIKSSSVLKKKMQRGGYISSYVD